VRAPVVTDFGATPELLDIQRPEPAAGEVRVRVRAASVNGFDNAAAAGYLKGMMEHRFPVVLGKDFAGEIDAVGADVDGFAVGDRVFGVVTKAHLGDGSFGEYVTVPTAVGLAKLPASIEFAEERNRIQQQLALLIAAAGLLMFAVLFAAVWVVVYFWDTNRLTAIAVVALVFAAAGAVLLFVRAQAARSAPTPFSATIAEFDRDRVALAGGTDREPSPPPLP